MLAHLGFLDGQNINFELNHVIRVAVNKHVFGENQIHLPSRHLDVLTEKLGRTKQNSAERKTRNQATFGNNCFLFRFICGAKINAEQKVAKNWSRPRAGPHTVLIFNNRHFHYYFFQYLKSLISSVYKFAKFSH